MNLIRFIKTQKQIKHNNIRLMCSVTANLKSYIFIKQPTSIEKSDTNLNVEDEDDNI